MRALILACLGLAALSLLLPSVPSYDPWAWIVWGREISGFELDTSGGPSWKPLPVAFTLLFAPLGAIDDSIPPALWLVVARAGALFACAMTFRLARRLTGSGGLGIAAGVIAVVALVLTPQWVRYTAHGNELPLAVGLMLLGVERHLDGKRSHALVLAFLACLLRPEVFPFLAAYAVLVWRWEPAHRRLVLGLAALLPIVWLVPEWIGAGNPFDAGDQATKEVSWSLARRDQPWLAVLERMHDVAGLPLELGALAGAVFAAVRRERAALFLFGAGVLWVLLVAVMTESGFSGNARYFAPAVAIACVLAGLGAARLVGAAGDLHFAAGAAVAVAIAIAVWPYTELRTQRVEKQARLAEELVDLQDELADAVAAAGGPERIGDGRPPGVNRVFMPRMAWESELSMGVLEDAYRRGYLFATEAPIAGNAPKAKPGDAPRQEVVRVGRWVVYGPPREEELRVSRR